jgi:NADH-quinone oxidoreductase subunit L
LLSPKPQPIDGAPALHALNEAATSAIEEPHSPEEIREERLLALLSVLIAASGIGAGWLIFQKRPLLQMPQILENKYYADEIYDAAIIQPILVGSREGLWKLFDVGVIDGFLHALGDAVKEGARLLRHLQGGFVRSYAAIILIGAIVVIGFFAYFGTIILGLAR